MGKINQSYFIKPYRIISHKLIFENATVKDAKFILSLRTDLIKSKFLSNTENDLEKQIKWLESYSKDDSQIYFIIKDFELNKVGTVRLYDQQDSSFCWGSWIIKDKSPSFYAISSALMVYIFAKSLGFTESHFDVRKDNISVWKFHESFGAIRIKESDIDYFYKINSFAIDSSIKKYSRFLPQGIRVESF